MCLILFAHRAHPRYPLVVAANRDEAYARPALPAAPWTDHPAVFGGRDLEAGGTWMALTGTGRFAALTNFRQGIGRDPGRRSRGDIVSGYVTGTAMAADYLDALRARDDAYNGYSVLAGDLTTLYFHSNRGNGVTAVAPGVHGLSNHLLDEPWPKVTAGMAVVASTLALDRETMVARLFEQLADRRQAPEPHLPSTGIDPQRERELSATFIAAERYGTRASTVMVVDEDGEAYLEERSFGPGGAALGRTQLTFRIATSMSSRGEGCPLP